MRNQKAWLQETANPPLLQMEKCHPQLCPNRETLLRSERLKFVRTKETESQFSSITEESMNGTLFFGQYKWAHTHRLFARHGHIRTIKQTVFFVSLVSVDIVITVPSLYHAKTADKVCQLWLEVAPSAIVFFGRGVWSTYLFSMCTYTRDWPIISNELHFNVFATAHCPTIREF